MRRSMLIAACLSFGLAGRPSPAAAPPAPAEPGWLTLGNGARLLLLPDPGSTAVDVAVWYEAGVRYERPGILGVSHLLEHLSARGVAPGGEAEVRRLIEAEGGTSASFTSADFTCFTHTVPRAALEAVFRLEAGRPGLRPTQSALDQERRIVREENRARARSNPLELGIQQLYATAFTSHPYRWAVLGSDGDLERIALRDCESYFRARYAPERAWITVVGDFDPEEALTLARRHFEPIRRRGGRWPEPAREPEMSGARRGAREGVLQVPVLMVGWRAPASGDDAPALDLLSVLLTRGPAGRLHRRLVGDEQSCLFTQTGRDGRRDGTMFWAAAGVRPGADTAAVERLLVAEVERLASEPVSGEELDRARRQLEVALHHGRQTARDRGQAAGTSQLLLGDWRAADRHLRRLATLTPDDLLQAAARTLAERRRIVVWMSAAPAPAAGAGGGP